MLLSGISGLWQIVNRYLGDWEGHNVRLGDYDSASGGRNVTKVTTLACYANMTKMAGASTSVLKMRSLRSRRPFFYLGLKLN